MSETSHHNGFAAPQIIKVPENCRPQLGSGAALPLATAVKRGTTIMATVARHNRALIRQLLTDMSEVIACSTDPFDALSLEKLLMVATDIRGVAATLGSPITSDIANTIFRLAEDAVSGPSRSLLVLLVEGNAKLLDLGDNGDLFEPELRALLAKLDASMT